MWLGFVSHQVRQINHVSLPFQVAFFSTLLFLKRATELKRGVCQCSARALFREGFALDLASRRSSGKHPGPVVPLCNSREVNYASRDCL